MPAVPLCLSAIQFPAGRLFCARRACDDGLQDVAGARTKPVAVKEKFATACGECIARGKARFDLVIAGRGHCDAQAYQTSGLIGDFLPPKVGGRGFTADGRSFRCEGIDYSAIQAHR